MLTFVLPWMLIGLGAVSLPIVIHLLTRARSRRIALPTYKLLVESGGGLQAVDRLRTFLVLLTRAVLVAALAVMFAQPFLAERRAVADTEAPRRVVLLVDASASMRANRAGVPLFGDARAQAADVLRGLSPGSAAAVVFIGATPKPVLPALSRNLAALHEGLEQAAPTYESADAQAALALANRMLEGQGDVFVFSDFQRTNWAAADLADLGGLRLYLRPIADRPVENVGITDARLSPLEPVAGEAVQLTCTLFNATPAARRQTVRLDIPGAGVSQEAEAALQPYASADVTFTFTAPGVGTLVGKVSTDPDVLDIDDERTFRLRVAPALKVLVLSDADADSPASGAFYVTKALAPSRSSSASGIEVTHRLSQQADRVSLESADVFVLVSPVTLSGQTLEVIARRVTEGAQLVTMLDGSTAPATVTALAGASRGAVTPPFELTRAIASPRGGEALGALVTSHGPLSIFDSPDQGDLQLLRVHRRYLSQNDTSRGSEVFAQYADGSAALSRSPAGRGAAVFCNFSVAPDASNLAGSPLFPVMLHELLRDLRRGGQRETNTVGVPWQVEVSAPDEVNAADGQINANGGTAYRVVNPDGDELSATVLSRGRTTRLALSPAPRPGGYEVRAGDRLLEVGVVNVDAAESDTRFVDAGDLALTGADGPVVDVVSAGSDLVRAGSKRANAWPWLLGIAAAALAVEMLLLTLWRKSPQRAPADTHRPRSMAAADARRRRDPQW